MSSISPIGAGRLDLGERYQATVNQRTSPRSRDWIAGAALLALIIAIGLSIYKPQGATPYGRRKSRKRARLS